MDLHASPAIGWIFHDRDLDYLLWEVNDVAHKLDPDIPTKDFYVGAQVSRYPTSWTGHAHPQEKYYDKRRGKTLECPNGRVTMSFGEYVSENRIRRLFAHELRHLGQFERGRKETGQLNLRHMYRLLVEPDCIAFEGRVLREMGLPDEYSDRTDQAFKALNRHSDKLDAAGIDLS